MPRIVQSDVFANQPYTIKAGEFRLLATPSLGLEWNDNVNTSDANAQDDFILRPLLELRASYPITTKNVLRVDVGIGYDQYLDHEELSTWRLQSGSAISLDMVIKDVTLNIHNRFSYVRDAARVGDVAGTAEQGNFENTAGISATAGLGDLIVGGGYDHQNAISTSEQFEYQDRSTEQIHSRVGARIHPQLMAGVQGSASFTTYDLPVLNDNIGYGGGVYAEWRPGHQFSIEPKFGYHVYDFRQTSAFVPAEDRSSWYADVSVRHQAREAIGYSLSAGHELRLGTQADLVDAWYARGQVNWNLTTRITAIPALFFEHASQSGGHAAGADDETYDWFGGSLAVQASLTPKMRASLVYRGTIRGSDAAGRDYAQNTVALQISYTLQ